LADKASERQDLLVPVEPCELLQRLKLTTGKAAQFTGVSRRQLTYWTDTGIVTAVEGEEEEGDSSRRAYDFDALHRVLLIKQALERSPGLRRAAREVDRYLAERQRRAQELQASIEQKRDEFLTEQADRLESLASRVRELLPQINDRDKLIELYDGLAWLEQMAGRVQAGEVLLEENADACLKLASLIEQAEARLEALAEASQ